MTVYLTHLEPQRPAQQRVPQIYLCELCGERLRRAIVVPNGTELGDHCNECQEVLDREDAEERVVASISADLEALMTDGYRGDARREALGRLLGAFFSPEGDGPEDRLIQEAAQQMGFDV